MKIEYVCTANNCRSETGRVITQRLVDILELEDEVEVDSSGTLVNVKPTVSVIQYVLKAALNLQSEGKDVFEDARRVEDIVEDSSATEKYDSDSNYKVQVDQLYGVARSNLGAVEREHMDDLLKMRGIDYKRQKPKQYRYNKFNGVVLPISGMNEEKVLEAIGERSENINPHVCELGRYAGREGNFTDCFGFSDPSRYEEFFEEMTHACKTALDRTLSGLSN